ncbi:MAG: c-type cytochrome [Pseudomonadota bacterium]
MKKWLKWSGITVATVVVLAAGGVLLGTHLGERKLVRRIEVPTVSVTLSADPAKLELGRYLFNSRGCAECHGANGGGHQVVKSGDMLIVSPNITPHADASVRNYRTEDWVRTLRHGVKPNGKPVLIMPSEDYSRLSDDDVAALIVYAKQLPPVAGNPVAIQLPVPVKVLYGAGMIQDAAEKIDHTLPPAKPVAISVSTEYGAYVANTCLGCHGAHLSGGKIPGAPPDWPAAANLTPGKGSAMPIYATAQAFTAMIRSGQRPDGSKVSSVMPFQSLKQMTDTDLQALYGYLKTLAARDAGQR